jgi:hypothetical protein
LYGDGDDFHLRILLLHELCGDDIHHHDLRVGLFHNGKARQGPERATTSDPWQRWQHGSSSSTMAARVLLYGGSKQGLDLGPTGLDLGSAFLFLKINFLNRST